MTQDTASGTELTQTAFWNAGRDRYSVEHLFGDGLGKLHDPDEEKPPNCWVIIRETRSVDSELPALSAVGVFKDGEVARRICELIISTAGSGGV